MDWDLKMPPWNASESADRDAGLSVGPVVAGAARDSSVDLKLGGLGEFGSSSSCKRNVRRPAAPSGSSKRPRAPPLASGGGGAASCLVEGCRADLGECGEYHRRHKVCEAHSKTPVVVVRGQEQRFCQQCSRSVPRHVPTRKRRGLPTRRKKEASCCVIVKKKLRGSQLRRMNEESGFLGDF